MQTYLEKLEKHGYVVVENIWEEKEIIELRSFFSNLNLKESNFKDDFYNIIQEKKRIIYKDKFFFALKSIFGQNFVFIPEPMLHINRYTDWHKDSTCQEYYDKNFNANINHHLYQIAIYFQNNIADNGGIDIVPNSLSYPNKLGKFYYSSGIKKFLLSLLKKSHISCFKYFEKNKIRLAHKTGDMVIFNIQLLHRSTGTNKEKYTITKYAIFNTVAKNLNEAKLYQDFLKTRPEPYYQWLNYTSLNQQFKTLLHEQKIQLYF